MTTPDIEAFRKVVHRELNSAERAKYHSKKYHQHANKWSAQGRIELCEKLLRIFRDWRAAQ